MVAATVDEGAAFESVAEVSDDPDAIPLGTRFYAVETGRINVYTLNGTRVAIGAEWVREAAGDPFRVVVGGDGQVCEILIREDCPPTTYRLDGTDRWDEFGNSKPGRGVKEALYLPTKPEYEAYRREIRSAMANDDPPTGRLFGRDIRQVVVEPIIPSNREECAFCNTGTQTRFRVRAWRGDVLFGVGRRRATTTNEMCPNCFDLTPDPEGELEYLHPDDSGDLPVVFQPTGRTDTGRLTADRDPLDASERPEHPDVAPEAKMRADAGDLTGIFYVYVIGHTDDTTPRRLLVAELFDDSGQVGGETATFEGTESDDIFRQARNIYASYWSEAREIDWDSINRMY